ncbi:MAG: MATE family efflux transporter [Lachnospiraceae bacterium]|nr:MATE family efflux transporter [Lachnospiraceae bacterium]
MEDNKKLFEEIPVPKALAKLAVPTIISQLIVMVYNLADTFFIGRTDDPYKVAATSMAYVLFFMLNALANLFGIGGGSLISRLLGVHETEDAKSVSSFSIYGTILVTIIYCIVCRMFMTPILSWIGASENTLGFATDYTMWVVVIGGIPATLSMTMSHLLRSEGHGSKASFGLSMGGILNIILDPLFMFLLFPKGHEVTGAAVATMLSNVVALMYYAYVFYRIRTDSVLSVSAKRLPAGWQYTGKLLSVGFPAALSTILVCVSIMVTNTLASLHGDIPVAAIGIVKKVEMLPHNVGTGLCQGMIPLIAYNYSSGNYRRMTKTINTARTYGLVFTFLCVIVFETFAGGISYLFIKDAETVSLTTDFLRIMCLATPLTICNFHICYTLQAMGKGNASLVLSACRQGIFNIPLMIMMNHWFGLYGIVWTQLIADTLTVILSLFIYKRTSDYKSKQ